MLTLGTEIKKSNKMSIMPVSSMYFYSHKIFDYRAELNSDVQLNGK